MFSSLSKIKVTVGKLRSRILWVKQFPNTIRFFNLFLSFIRSCWAFAALTALEAAIFIKTGKSMALSEQQLVDCSYRSQGWDGCQGGWMGDAYEYLQASIGSDRESAYPVKKLNC